MSKLEAKTQLRKPLILAAGIIGTIQGIAWSILALLSIFYYNGIIEPSENEVNYGTWVFLMFHKTTSLDIIVNDVTFNVFMYVYLVLSFIWLWNSTYVIWGIVHNKWEHVYYSISTWVILTCSISILDIILMSLLIADYVKITHDMGTLSLEGQALYGITISLAARGYILWIVNVTFASILAIFRFQIQKDETPQRKSIIDAYSTGNTPRFDTGAMNNAFVLDEEDQAPRVSFNPLSNGPPRQLSNPEFPRPNMYEYTGNNYQPEPIGENYPAPSFAPYNGEHSRYRDSESPISERVAKIGKSNGRKTPLQSVTPPSVPRIPYIPPPDYSPPSSLRHIPKSALKPQNESRYII